jgi:6-phosphogluconolactonase
MSGTTGEQALPGTAGELGRPRVVVLADPEALARQAAGLVVESLRAAVERRGRADVALTGGSSAAALYRTLAGPDHGTRVDWTPVHFWWGDERYVPSTHPLSNALQAYTHLLAIAARANESGEGAGASDVKAGKVPGLDVPAENVHPVPVDLAIARGPGGAAWAAEQYAAELHRALPAGADGVPAFDLILLGVGTDGHILSVFPGSRALHERGALVMAVPTPTHVEPHVERITLTPRVLDAAGSIVVMVPGEGKAEVVGDLFRAERDPDRWPAQLAMRASATWLLDEASAAQLPVEVAAARPS